MKEEEEENEAEVVGDVVYTTYLYSRMLVVRTLCVDPPFSRILTARQ